MSSSRRSRLRLVVIQALVFSLFATFFVRLYYLQVVSGEVYQGRAAAQSVREIVVQPARGLIVDDQGRPLVANRLSWVVSIDRTVLGKLSEQQGRTLVKRVARVVDQRPAPHAQEAGHVWFRWVGTRRLLERLALPAGAGRPRRRPGSRPADPRAAGGLPRRGGQATDGAGLSAAVRHQRRPPARLPEPDHRGRARPGRVRRRPFGQRSVGGRPRRHRAGVRRVAARHARLREGRGRLDGSRPGRRQPDRGPAGRHPGHLAGRQGAGHRRAAAGRDHRHRPRHPRHGHRSQLRGGLRCGGGDGGRHRPDRRDGQPADVRPGGVGRRDHQEAARGSLLEEGRHPAARTSHPGPVRARFDVEALHDRRRPDQRLLVRHPAELLVVVPGRQPGLQELRVGCLRLHRLRQGARGLVQHLLLPGRLRLLGPLRLRRGRRERQGPAGQGGQGVRLRSRDRHRPAG